LSAAQDEDRRPPAGLAVPRVLGHLVGARSGPVVVVVGGVHGNEPAGVRAAVEVLDALRVRLRNGEARLRGEVIGLSGHRAALALGVRALNRDLNRCFTAASVSALRAQSPALDDAEQREQRALLEAFDLAENRAAEMGEGLLLLDLHTTSAGGPPFALMGETGRNLKLASGLPVPAILGLQESVGGTLLELANDRGHTSLAVESGQHLDPEAERLHVAIVWITLVSAGALTAADVPDFDAHFARLAATTAGIPRVLDLVYRHAVRPEDRFVMRPGYEGFQRIRRGEVLADDAQGEVRAPSDGRVLMPLYQPQGSDGFFVVRAVGRLPLKLSAAARRVGLRRLPFRFRRPPVVPHHGAPISDGAPAPTAAHAPQSPEKTR
jgi:succinylglutamate desuccinylase